MGRCVSTMLCWGWEFYVNGLGYGIGGEGELEYELQKKVTAQAVADEFRVPAG